MGRVVRLTEQELTGLLNNLTMSGLFGSSSEFKIETGAANLNCKYEHALKEK